MLMEADLPDDVDALRALVLEQARKLESADAEAERLRAIIEAFRRHRFGRRSEQLDQDQLQLGLEDAETALAEAEAASTCPGQSITAFIRKRNDRIVECRADMRYTKFYVLAVLFLRTN